MVVATGDVFRIIDLINRIVHAAKSAQKLKEDCHSLAEYLGDVNLQLEKLQGKTLSNSTLRILGKLKGILWKSYNLVRSLTSLNFLNKMAKIKSIREDLKGAQDEIHRYMFLLSFAHSLDAADPRMGRTEINISDQHRHGGTENIMRDQNRHTLQGASQGASSTPAQLIGEERRNNTVFPMGVPDVFPPKFKIQELKSATMHFNDKNIVGKGGTGTVYIGWINDKVLKAKAGGVSGSKWGPGPMTTIAVKRFGVSSSEPRDKKIDMYLFEAEMEFLRNMQHPNVIKLLGYYRGKKKGENMLVYEYMRKGNLAQHIFDEQAVSHPLPWETRINIALGVARALSHLHASYVIHRDVKPFNVLLDSKFNPKLSDFGLAINGPTDRDFYVKASLAGTCRYMDPYYIATGRVNEKADVFGFGVLLIEMLTSKHASNLKITTAESLSYANDTIQSEEDVRQTGKHRRAKSLSDDASEASQQNSEHVRSFLNKMGGLYASFSLRKVSKYESQPGARDFNGAIVSNSLYEKNISKYISEDQKLRKMMDPNLRGQYPLEAARGAAELARRCVALHPNGRPSMEEVVKTLEQIQNVRMPPSIANDPANFSSKVEEPTANRSPSKPTSQESPAQAQCGCRISSPGMARVHVQPQGEPSTAQISLLHQPVGTGDEDVAKQIGTENNIFKKSQIETVEGLGKPDAQSTLEDEDSKRPLVPEKSKKFSIRKICCCCGE